MGSTSASPPPLPPQNATSSHRVYTSFCGKQPRPNINISNWIECHDVTTNTSIHVTSIPGLSENLVLKDFSMISIGDSIYVIGGRVCYKLNENVEMDVRVVSDVLRYDTASNLWAKCSPLNVPRYNFACTMHDNKIYVAGGQTTMSSAKGISSAEVYDPLLDQWSSLPNMHRQRYKSVGVTWQGKIYAVGGFVEGGNRDLMVDYIHRCSAEVYDVEHQRWGLVTGMWQLDVPPNQIVTIDGKLFSSGDLLTAWKGHIEDYDEELNIWNIVKGSKFKIFGGFEEGNWNSIERLYLTMSPIGSCLFFLAGYKVNGESSSMMSAVHIFDTSASENAWKSFEPLQVEGERELCSHCCVVRVS